MELLEFETYNPPKRKDEVEVRELQTVEQLVNSECGSWKEAKGALRYMLFRESVWQRSGRHLEVERRKPSWKIRMIVGIATLVQFAVIAVVGVFVGILIGVKGWMWSCDDRGKNTINNWLLSPTVVVYECKKVTVRGHRAKQKLV